MGYNLYIVLAACAAGLAIIGFAVSGRARAWAGRLFVGQSLQALTSTFGDQMAGAQAAYAIAEAERKRLELVVIAKQTEIDAMRSQMQVLTDAVTSRAEVAQLSQLVTERHFEIMGALHEIATLDQIKDALKVVNGGKSS